MNIWQIIGYVALICVFFVIAMIVDNKEKTKEVISNTIKKVKRKDYIKKEEPKGYEDKKMSENKTESTKIQQHVTKNGLRALYEAKLLNKKGEKLYMDVLHGNINLEETKGMGSIFEL